MGVAPKPSCCLFSWRGFFFFSRGLCFGYKKDLGSNANWYQLLGPRSRWGTLSAHVPPQLSPRGAPASPAPLAADCLSKQPPEVPDSVILAHCQWSCREDSGPVAWYLPVWSDGPASSGKQEEGTPIMPLLLDSAQTPPRLTSLPSPDPVCFLAWICMFVCHCPSLGCELLQGRDRLSHPLFPVLLVRLGTT